MKLIAISCDEETDHAFIPKINRGLIVKKKHPHSTSAYSNAHNIVARNTVSAFILKTRISSSIHTYIGCILFHVIYIGICSRRVEGRTVDGSFQPNRGFYHEPFETISSSLLQLFKYDSYVSLL